MGEVEVGPAGLGDVAVAVLLRVGEVPIGDEVEVGTSFGSAADAEHVGRFGGVDGEVGELAGAEVVFVEVGLAGSGGGVAGQLVFVREEDLGAFGVGITGRLPPPLGPGAPAAAASTCTVQAISASVHSPPLPRALCSCIGLRRT